MTVNRAAQCACRTRDLSINTEPLNAGNDNRGQDTQHGEDDDQFNKGESAV